MSSVTSKEWSFTCPNCPWVPPRSDEPDYIRSSKISKRTGEPAWIALHYPFRCTPCNTAQRRYQRMNKRLDKIWKLSFTLDRKYRRPKLITFALPSKTTLSHCPESELKN